MRIIVEIAVESYVQDHDDDIQYQTIRRDLRSLTKKQDIKTRHCYLVIDAAKGQKRDTISSLFFSLSIPTGLLMCSGSLCSLVYI